MSRPSTTPRRRFDGSRSDADRGVESATAVWSVIASTLSNERPKVSRSNPTPAVLGLQYDRESTGANSRHHGAWTHPRQPGSVEHRPFVSVVGSVPAIHQCGFHLRRTSDGGSHSSPELGGRHDARLDRPVQPMRAAHGRHRLWRPPCVSLRPLGANVQRRQRRGRGKVGKLAVRNRRQHTRLHRRSIERLLQDAHDAPRTPGTWPADRPSSPTTTQSLWRRLQLCRACLTPTARWQH